MPRTTWQQHAIVEKRIINLDRYDPGPVACAWDDCSGRATILYRVRLCEHSPNLSCEAVDRGAGGRHMWFAFCRERCRQYWINASGRHAVESAERNRGRIHGMLPAGYRLSI